MKSYQHERQKLYLIERRMTTYLEIFQGDWRVGRGRGCLPEGLEKAMEGVGPEPGDETILCWDVTQRGRYSWCERKREQVLNLLCESANLLATRERELDKETYSL